jgi:2-alkenal reductase
MKRLIITSVLVVALGVAGCIAAGQQPLTVAPQVPQVIDRAASSSAPIDVTTEEKAFTSVYERVNPSVVNIRVVLTPQTNINPFPDFQFQFPGLPEIPSPQTAPQQAEGSGFVYDTQGHIVTNNHVAGNADKIVVTFADGTEAAATLAGADPDSDLAVIKVDVDPSQLHPATLGESDALKVGQITIAIGNPFGLQGSMSTGIVSGLGRLLSEDQSTNQPSYSIPDIIQTDTAINPGNSGGPLLNLSGEVIGVNTAIATSLGQNSGVGYAVPVDLVKQVVPELIQNGKVEHPYLGITSVALNADLARAMNLDANQRGVMVVEVAENSPASRAALRGSSKQVEIDGLQAMVGGDVIVGVDQQEVKVFDDLLTYLVRHTRVGQSITLHILRDGQPQDVTLTLAARPAH